MPDATRGMLFDSVLPTGHTVRVDVSPQFGGESLGPDPKELLLVSLGACTGLDVISILRKKRQDVTQYSINVFATEAEDHPKIYTSILVEHVVGGHSIDPKAVARSIELSITKYCPVHALLSKVIPVEHVYRVLEEV
jgi:putative redox protein